MKIFKNRMGFTLLELLVVISIIGILIAIGSVAFTTSQKKGRDARRRADIKAMQDGFEQYYASNSSSYDLSAADCSTMTADTTLFPAGVPLDPKNNATYYYNCVSSTTAYTACAQLETAGGNATSYTGTGLGSTIDGDFYCLVNLQ